MTKQKATKRALLLSALVLLLCVSMLVGSTFAWFSDSVTSGSNVIQSGNLDIDVQYTLDGTTWKDLDGAKDLFQKGSWEPGHTEVVALKIENKGSLALKYNANMNIFDETIGMNKDGDDIKLSDILTVSTLSRAAVDENGINEIGAITVGLAFEDENSVAYETTTNFNRAILDADQMLLPGHSYYVIVKVDMAENVSNKANHDGVHIPSIKFGIDVLAAQYSEYEADTFGKDYDKDAEYDYPLIDVATLSEFKTALDSSSIRRINLVAEIKVPAGETLTSNGATSISSKDGYGITFMGNIAIGGEGTLTLDVDTTCNSEMRIVDSAEVVFEGGSHKWALFAVEEDATVTIEDGKYQFIAGTCNGNSFPDFILSEKATLNINGGEIHNEPDNSDFDFDLSGYGQGAVTDVTVNITGGKFFDYWNFFTVRNSNNSGNTHVNISGGEFYNTERLLMNSNYNDPTASADGILTLTGGTFDGGEGAAFGLERFTKYVPEGYKVEGNSFPISVVAE